LIQNFTELGFGIARAPVALTKALQEALLQGQTDHDITMEDKAVHVPELGGPRSLFYNRSELMDHALKVLQPIASAWAGKGAIPLPLEPQEAYGIRVYRNQSVWGMHVDKKESHIIGVMYHIDHAAFSKPWPLVIEDLHGRTHSLILSPGDILLYESAKLLHGRPIPLDGAWYADVFCHYYPANLGWKQMDQQMETHYIIPPDWTDNTPRQVDDEESLPPLRMVGTYFHEPTCPYGWCPASSSEVKHWTGPAVAGHWIDPNHEAHEFREELLIAHSGDEL